MKYKIVWVLSNVDGDSSSSSEVIVHSVWKNRLAIFVSSCSMVFETSRGTGEYVTLIPNPFSSRRYWWPSNVDFVIFWGCGWLHRKQNFWRFYYWTSSLNCCKPSCEILSALKQTLFKMTCLWISSLFNFNLDNIVVSKYSVLSTCRFLMMQVGVAF